MKELFNSRKKWSLLSLLVDPQTDFYSISFYQLILFLALVREIEKNQYFYVLFCFLCVLNYYSSIYFIFYCFPFSFSFFYCLLYYISFSFRLIENSRVAFSQVEARNTLGISFYLLFYVRYMSETKREFPILKFNTILNEIIRDCKWKFLSHIHLPHIVGTKRSHALIFKYLIHEAMIWFLSI